MIKSLHFYSVLIMVVLSLISCSKDDEGFTVDGTNIEGTWVPSTEYAMYGGNSINTYITISSNGEICCYERSSYSANRGGYEIEEGYIIDNRIYDDVLYRDYIRNNSFYHSETQGFNYSVKIKVIDKETIKFLIHYTIHALYVHEEGDKEEIYKKIKGVKSDDDDDNEKNAIETPVVIDNGGNNGNDGTGNGDNGNNNGDNNGNNNNSGNDDNNSNTNNVDWSGNWQNVSDDFSRSTPFRKIRVLNKQCSNINYCCAFFSIYPNDNTTDDTNYNINFFNRTIGDNHPQGPNGIKISSCKSVGDNWYEYEFSTTLYFSHYQTNTPRDQLRVLAEYQTR